jgi:single-strand DNA-binding protein
MAGNFNKVILLGNLTRDPELRHTPQTNMAVANIGLAVNRRWRDQGGEQREETTFVDCEAWGKTAETMCQYLAKGRPVFVEGRLKLDTWQDKQSGENRSKLKVVVENFQFVDSRPGAGGGPGEGGGSRRASAGAPSSGGHAPEPMGDDDIPF